MASPLGPLPLLAPQHKIISSRCLTTRDGLEYWSRVYDLGNAICKQASRDLALREAAFLSRLKGPFFPRVISHSSCGEYSIVLIQRITGIPLDDVPHDFRGSPDRFLAFVDDCLEILAQLEEAGITHRDISPSNILIADRKPVLIDFGWAISTDRTEFDPEFLASRTPTGEICDAYAFGKVFEFVNQGCLALCDAVISCMIDGDSLERIRDRSLLRSMFRIASRADSRTQARPLEHMRMETSEQASLDASPELASVLLRQIAARQQRLSAISRADWRSKQHTALEQLRGLLQDNEYFVLIDEDRWPISEDPLSCRRLPFYPPIVEHWTLASQSQKMIHQLEDVRGQGAAIIAFAWYSFWWLSYYDSFNDYLSNKYCRVLANERLIAFDLRRSLQSQSGC